MQISSFYPTNSMKFEYHDKWLFIGVKRMKNNNLFM